MSVSMAGELSLPTGAASARATRILVSLQAIGENFSAVRDALPKGTRIISVVKADAYAHGARTVAPYLLSKGSFGVAVATADEALALRRAGVHSFVMVLSHPALAELAPLVAEGVSITVGTAEQVAATGRVGERVGRPAKLQVKVDTGMGRIGCPPEEADALLAQAATTEGAKLEGLFTHLASADADEIYTKRQLAMFDSLATRARKKHPSLLIHALNTAGVFRYPKAAYDAVRVGLAMYGYLPFEEKGSEDPALQPALEWVTAVSQVKQVPAGTAISYGATYRTSGEATIATLPVGYADGARRALSGLRVIIGGGLFPIVGRVTMDQMMVELPPHHPVKPGDEAVLIGRREPLTVTAEDWARHLGTIPYEVLVGIGPRVPRAYIEDRPAGR